MEQQLREQNSSKISKKLLNILRIMIYLAKRSFKKSNKLIIDLQTLLKGPKLATKKALNQYYSALICKSSDSNLSFISPREYEFSCSNTPARSRRKSLNYDVVVVKNVIEILNRYDESSPLNLPGFGRNSPNYVVRQLRVTDSPFQLEDCCDDEVDKDCEDFIEKFYKELKNQRRDSPLLQYRR